MYCYNDELIYLYSKKLINKEYYPIELNKSLNVS